MRLLVAGADRVDAGKTTFATGLVEHTGAVGYKPRAGNDYWHDHGDYERATRDGRLYGKDAARLAEATDADLEPEAINPVHRLWRPSAGPATGVLGQEDREFLADRVGDALVVNGTVDLPESLRERLPVAEATTVTDLAEFDGLMERLHAPALADLADRIAGENRAVVESYSDVARPLQDLEPDAVAVVEPGRARIYDGDRYWKACQVASSSPIDGRREERVGAVVDLIEAEADVGLPALAGDERSDPAAVADRYEHAYDALLAAAF
ncbi:ATPase [Halomicrobium salinisoli]|uniref:ATPase n=1 Tax=Halomicrobium salinisoli TaxID=2878391 RepID=UPI001CEFCBB4|nr:ATPase [Halomicrobium salinisoli]